MISARADDGKNFGRQLSLRFLMANHMVTMKNLLRNDPRCRGFAGLEPLKVEDLQKNLHQNGWFQNRLARFRVSIRVFPKKRYPKMDGL